MAGTLSIFEMFGFYDRMTCVDELPPNRHSWKFEELYNEWIRMNFFKKLHELGFLKVSYNNSPFVDFVPSAENVNRHQALALSTFLSSHFADSSVKVICPHASGVDNFEAVFERINKNEVHYVNANGIRVRFQFDSSRASQFPVHQRLF